jgi:signal transduction histidine kinase
VQDDGGSGTRGVDGLDFGLGLVGLRERVESLGGIFCVSERIGGGTIVDMTLIIAEETQDG